MIAEAVEIAPSPAQAAAPSRLAFLDGVRGAAALFVVLHHTYLTIWAGPHGPYGMPSVRVQGVANWMLFGRLAVDVFIVLSGYCLMMPVLRHRSLKGGTLHFYRRRIRRIIPTYYASIGLSLLLIYLLIGKHTGTHWDASLPVTGHAIANALLLVQNFGLPRINHVYWSIAVECQIYVLFPLMVWLWFRAGGIGTVLIVCAAVWGMWHWGSPYGLEISAFWYLALFTFGAAAVNVVQSPDGAWPMLRRLPWRAITAGLAIVALAVCFAWGPYPAGRRLILEDLAVGAASSALLIVMALHERSFLRRIAQHRLLAGIGLFSYSLYLIHAPLLQVMWQYGVGRLPMRSTYAFALLAAIGIPACVGASFLFYLIFEKRFANPPTRRAKVTPAASADKIEPRGAAIETPAPIAGT